MSTSKPAPAGSHPGPTDEAWAPADPLGEALHFLRMTGVVYANSELTAPWGVDLPPIPGCIMFHVLTQGQCWLDTGDGAPIQLRPGEFTLVPHGAGHALADALDSERKDFFDLPVEQVSPHYEFLRYGGGGEETRLICGAVRFDHPAARELASLLPSVIHVQAWHSSESEWMQSTLRFMASEVAGRRPGGETVVTRLADILVIQAIRSWIAHNPDAQTGWLGALHDDRIGPSILYIQREPERDWTVESLASAVSMSRSAFASRFRELVGESPIEYLTRWRMHTAVTWLCEGDQTIAEMAMRLGYKSEAAFSRAFKRVIGDAPGQVRRAAREQALAS